MNERAIIVVQFAIEQKFEMGDSSPRGSSSVCVKTTFKRDPSFSIDVNDETVVRMENVFFREKPKPRR